jgi:pimeloyl-ACP methyl ester carboxylesterase
VLEDVTRRRLPLPDRGVEIALLDWGGGGPVALLHHANGFCAAMFEPVARELRRHYRVVAMDGRGHGDSSKPEGDGAYAWHHFGDDALAVARALAATRADRRVALALGHSFGGTALMLAASQDSQLFERLVMVDPVLRPPDGGPMIDPARLSRVGSMVDRARKRREVFESREDARESWRDKEMFSRWTPRAFELYLAEGLADRPDGRVELKCPAAVEAAIFAAGPDFDPWEVATRVKTPALMLWAERGDFPRRVYEEVASRMADARVRDVAAGHLVPMERPELVVEAVLDFAVGSRGQRSVG